MFWTLVRETRKRKRGSDCYEWQGRSARDVSWNQFTAFEMSFSEYYPAVTLEAEQELFGELMTQKTCLLNVLDVGQRNPEEKEGSNSALKRSARDASRNRFTTFEMFFSEYYPATSRLKQNKSYLTS